MLKAKPHSKLIRRGLRLAMVMLMGLGLFLTSAAIKDVVGLRFIASPPVAAQAFRPQDAWPQVYQRLPDFPLENNYISKETGQVDTNNTLVGRLVRYHLYVKSRSPYYRFDWKLTMADYLGAYEFMAASQYPSNSTLETNPMAGDRDVIEALTRRQRNDLIDVLVSLFNPNLSTTPEPSPTESPSPEPTPNPEQTPGLPNPGDADLLRP